jgi:hypothetical protein
MRKRTKIDAGGHEALKDGAKIIVDALPPDELIELIIAFSPRAVFPAAPQDGAGAPR